jgi:hypothetical protein
VKRQWRSAGLDFRPKRILKVSALRKVGRSFRRFVGFSKPNRELEPGAEALALAVDLCGVEGSSLVFCGSCRTVLVPIVYADTERAEVISLGCLNCLGSVQVAVGIVIDQPSSPSLALR